MRCSARGSNAMTEASAPERALRAIVAQLEGRGRTFALVGGLAVSIRAEVRFTRDVDLVVAVSDDADAEALVRELSAAGYRPLALVEHELAKRLSTVDMTTVRGDLALIRERGFDRGQDLEGKLADLLDSVARDSRS